MIVCNLCNNPKSRLHTQDGSCCYCGGYPHIPKKDKNNID